VGHVLRTQRNARVELAVALAVLLLAWWLGLPARDWAVLLLTIGGVLAAEMVNTVIEALVDLVSPEYHERARIAKDAAAGAVLMLALASVLVGLCLLGPPLWERLRGL
jgi:undecaprenol kinase/diacylglycerol kinase (ATP)